MKRWFLLLLALLTAVGLVTGCATLDEKQRGWIFQPSDRSWWRGEQAAEGMQDVWIPFTSQETGQPVKLHGLWLEHPDFARRPDAPVLLYLHGARFNVVGSAFRARRMQELGFSVLAIDYRGFGRPRRSCPRKPWPTRMRAPPGPGWRSGTPAPALHLRPLARRRHRHRPGSPGGG